MVRIGVPAVTCVAIMALSACGSIHGPHVPPDGARPAIDYVRFPPPPPVPPLPAQAARADAGIAGELAELQSSLGRLSGEIERARRHLADLEAEVERSRARIEQFLGRQQPGAGAPIPAQQASAAPGLRPLVRIRCEEAAGVDCADYDDALRGAVSAALERLPDAVFDLVAVNPDGTAAEPQGNGVAWLHAEEVAASLVAMGIEPNRLSLSSTLSETAGASEVHLYVR